MTRSAKTFQPRMDILSPAQRRLWDELGATPPHFVLYGGTAIALRLGHRQSDDFDFFSGPGFSPAALLSRIAYLKNAEVIQEAENTLTVLVGRGEPVRVSFFGGLNLNRAGEPEQAASSGVWVASLLDLAATKMAVVVERAAKKDYQDVAALLAAGIALPQALAAARAVYGAQYNPMLSLKALTFFEEGDLPQLERAYREALVDAVRTTDVARLPVVEPLKGLA